LHGGKILPVLDRKSQVAKNGYIIASYLPPSKRRDFKDYKVVTEDWILESCTKGRLLDWRDFRLQHNEGETDVNGQVPGGVPVAQQNLLNLRKPKPVTPTKMRPSTDDAKVESPYLPTKRTHRAAQLLMDDAWRKQHTAVAPDFIDGYFKQSRLHHLSTWKAELPFMVARLCDELVKEGKIATDHQLLAESNQRNLTGTATDARTIFHVDFDCFFSSAGLIARPELRGKPVAVCHAGAGGEGLGSTSEIASCSYEAREHGVRNGMRCVFSA
jgi:DNA repair protein REV1